MSDLFEALRLFITNTGSRSRLDVGGELDVATVGPFGDHLALLVDAGSGDIDVDMALVTFCDARRCASSSPPTTSSAHEADACVSSTAHDPSCVC